MNASSVRRFADLSAAAGEALWPSTVRLPDGTHITATIVPPRESFVLDMTGEDPAPLTLVVRIRKDLLTTAPAVHGFLTWDRKRWKIRSVEGSDRPTEAEHTLTCEAAP